MFKHQKDLQIMWIYAIQVTERKLFFDLLEIKKFKLLINYDISFGCSYDILSICNHLSLRCRISINVG